MDNYIPDNGNMDYQVRPVEQAPDYQKAASAAVVAGLSGHAPADQVYTRALDEYKNNGGVSPTVDNIQAQANQDHIDESKLAVHGFLNDTYATPEEKAGYIKTIQDKLQNTMESGGVNLSNRAVDMAAAHNSNWSDDVLE